MPIQILKKKNNFNVGITLSHNLLGMATMECIKFVLSLNGYQSHCWIIHAFVCFISFSFYPSIETAANCIQSLY